MFSREYLQEISLTLKRNKLRTFLTGFSVAWGVLFLLLLLGVGTGIRSAMVYNINNNTSIDEEVTLYLNSTSIPYKGYDSQEISLSDSEWNIIKEAIPSIKGLYIFKSKFRQIETEGNSSSSGRVIGINPGYTQKLHNLNIIHGRSINASDHRLLEKNVVLSAPLASKMFGRTNITGKYIKISGMGRYKVIGVYQTNQGYQCHIPLSVFERLLPRNSLSSSVADLYCPDIQDETALERLRLEIFAKLRLMKPIHPQDDQVIYLRSALEERQSLDSAMTGLDLFLWIMGLSTILIGIVGVSNIMLVTVRERIREIGIRKALGAKKKHIIAMIMSESIVVTLISGLIGLMLAVAILVGVEHLLETLQIGQKTIDSMTFFVFKNPIIPPAIALMTVLVMVIAGGLAGFFPAKKAISIPAVEAMRE